MARHAFSLSDALAMQYCDPGTSTSRAPKSALAEHRPSTVARCDDAGRPRGRTSSKEAAVAARLPPSRRRIHRLPALTACVLVGLASLLPCSTALFDPGEPAPPPAPQIVSTSTSSNDAIPTNALVASSGPPISLPPGCRRTTDLFSDVCQNPWSGGAVRGDLVICPLPDVKPLLKGARMGSQGQGNVGPAEEGTGEQIFAVSGTVTIKYQDGAGDAGIPGQARLGQGQPENGHVKEEPGLPQDGGASLPNFPAEGDEGYWRQRDGQQEWQPVEPDPLMNPTKEATDPQGPAQQDEAALSSAHARAYDAWTAEMGNESGAASFLSFSEWREKHLAAEKERERKEAEAHEKNRMHGAKGRKGEKAKEKAKGPGTTPSGDKAAQSQARTDRTASTTGNEHPTEVSGSPSSARTRPAQESDDLGKATANVSDSHASASEAELAAGSSKDETLGLDDVFGEGVNPDFLSAATLENLHSGEGAASQDQVDLSEHYSKNGDAIPALANPKARLAELKHRWNFASFDCAAVVHRSNPSARFTSAILSEKKDRYMLSPCPTDGEGQFVVVELCDEIMIDTVVLANYEFFSRMFKRFRVRVARNLQGKEDEWFEVGTFRARNVRGLQVFATPTPTAGFYRYVRIDFQEHYGSEYYCPISLLRVYGLTQMEDYVREEEEKLKRQRELEKLESEPLELDGEGEGEDEVEDEAAQNHRHQADEVGDKHDGDNVQEQITAGAPTLGAVTSAAANRKDSERDAPLPSTQPQQAGESPAPSTEVSFASPSATGDVIADDRLTQTSWRNTSSDQATASSPSSDRSAESPGGTTTSSSAVATRSAAIDSAYNASNVSGQGPNQQEHAYEVDLPKQALPNVMPANASGAEIGQMTFNTSASGNVIGSSADVSSAPTLVASSASSSSKASSGANAEVSLSDASFEARASESTPGPHASSDSQRTDETKAAPAKSASQKLSTQSASKSSTNKPDSTAHSATHSASINVAANQGAGSSSPVAQQSNGPGAGANTGSASIGSASAHSATSAPHAVPHTERNTVSTGAHQSVGSAGGSSGSAASGSGGSGAVTSESIYRTITKRLNVLEANATLSLQYIEHSSQMLRDVFARMERKQDERMGEMLRALNSSNWRQIEALKRKQQVDLQKALFEFDMHRQQVDTERLALLAQVHLLADEVMLEKRLGITQLVLLLAMFVFMGLTRGSRAAPFIHSSLARISRTPRSTTAPRPYLTSATPRVEDFSPTDSKVVSRGDSKPHLHSAPPNGSMNVSATESPSVTTRSSLQRLASPGRERTKGGFERAVRLPVANGRAHRLTNLVGQTRGLRSARPKHARQTSASLDFSEMSPAALRSYHGFPSPRAPSSSASGSEPPTAPFPSEGSRAARSVSRERVSGMAAVASSEEGTPRRSKATSSSHADRRQSNSETSEWTERSEDESAYERERDPIVVSAPSPRVHLPTPEPDLQPHIQPQLQKDDEGAPWQQVVSSRRSNSSSRPRNRPTSTGSLHSPARAGTPDTVRGPSNTPPPPHRSLSKSKPFTFGSSQSSHTTICP